MLLNKSQKEKFKEAYANATTLELCKQYGASSKSILGLAKAMGIYEPKNLKKP